MFTGIIETMARVLSFEKGTLILECPGVFDDVKIGCSISISGVCLTVTAFDQRLLSFDVVEETLRKSMLGSLRAGRRVNLERALLANGRFDGHIVQGHVEGTGTVISLHRSPDEKKEVISSLRETIKKFSSFLPKEEKSLVVQIPADLLPSLIPKGSITIDGVSLTIVEIKSDHCTVALIPETLAKTTLGELQPGDQVNIETDILVRSIKHLIDRHVSQVEQKN